MAGQHVIAIAGGGTGGHIYPALAIGDAWLAAEPGADVFFVGTHGGLETKLVPQRGYEIETVAGSRLVGGGPVARLRGVVSLVRGVLAARRILRRRRASLVVGTGGYASGAALLAAWTLRLGTAVHESNAVPGFTNKVLGRLVRRVYLGFEAARASFPPARVRVVGNPVRAEIAALPASRTRPDGRPWRVIVVGGSQGALFLNEEVPALLAALVARGVEVDVRHQVGKRDPEPVREAYATAGLQADVVRYIDEMAEAWQHADLAITRAGSGTVSELAAAGLPALLVPFPYAAGDHQFHNAQAFARAGAGICVRQRDWDTAAVAERLHIELMGPQRYPAAVEAARTLALPDAAAAVVRDCAAWMAARWA